MQSSSPRDWSAATASGADAAQLEAALFEVKKVIVGQDRVLERLFVCMLARGHCLLEGVPGLAKTLAMESMARAVGGTFNRIQFTPDLLPADVMGTRIYRHSSETFDIEWGPVFANFVLADEINRAPAKVQSALLEIMAERQVSIAGVTRPAPEPFLVLATQNPIESEGVYPLPEAQRDRFLMKVLVDYPSPSEELDIVRRMGSVPPVSNQVLSAEQLSALQREASLVYVDGAVQEYAVNLVLATRHPDQYGLAELAPLIDYGASPRASLGLVAGARAIALLRGRRYAVPQDVFDVAPEVLRHRLVLSFEALAQSLVADQILARLLATVPAPRVTPAMEGGDASRSRPVHRATISRPGAPADLASGGQPWAAEQPTAELARPVGPVISIGPPSPPSPPPPTPSNAGPGSGTFDAPPPPLAPPSSWPPPPPSPDTGADERAS